MIKNKDIMLKKGQFPIVQYNLILKETLEEMNKFNLGVACLVDKNCPNLKNISKRPCKARFCAVPLSNFC